jgi:hypothetical protein
MRSPVARLSNAAALVWACFALGGPALILFGGEASSSIGTGMLLMSMGFMLFGLGLERETEHESGERHPPAQ